MALRGLGGLATLGVFTRIRLEYVVSSSAPRDVVEEAVRLSMDRLCSIKAMVEGTAEVTWAVSLKP